MNVDVFVQNIKKLCFEKGESPTNACKNSGVGASFISDLNRGRTPSISKAQALAEYLGVTTSALLGEPEPPRIPAEADARAAEALKLFEQLPPEQKTAALGFLEYLLSQGGGGEK